MIRAARLSAAVIAACLTLHAAGYTVAFRKTLSVPLQGATAAYSVDPTIAEASAENGIIQITGRGFGTTHIVVITATGIQSLEVFVPIPPPNRPKGFVMPRASNEANESAFVETRYASLPRQISSVTDFSRQSPEESVHFHATTTNFLTPQRDPLQLGNFSRFALTSAYYEYVNRRRKVTLADQYMQESPLTVDNAIVRGIHWQEGDWFVHLGYTSPASFQNVFLPSLKEGVLGAGKRLRINPRSTLTPSIYRFSMPAANLTGKSGYVYSLLYSYRSDDDFRVAAEIGASRGVGGSFDLFYRKPTQSLRARTHYTPRRFAALSIANFRGFYSDVSWTRVLSSKLTSDVTFTGNRFELPNFEEINISGGVQLRYAFTQHWSVLGGASYSRFELKSPQQRPVQAVYYPAGLSFAARRLGATFQYQWSSYTGRDTGGRQILASLRTGIGPLRFSAFAQQQTQVPTLGFLLSQIDGLEETLTQMGVRATTPQQIASFLRENQALISLGYLRNVTINVTPVRTQLGGTAAWQGSAKGPQLTYEFLYNQDQTVASSTQLEIDRLTLTQRLGTANDILLSWARYRTKAPGMPSIVQPLYMLSLRHQFDRAPGLLVLRHSGSISGSVFRDDEGQGVFAPNLQGLGGVEVLLDERRKTRSGSDGRFRFSGVSPGVHQVRAVLHDNGPSYFTTAAQVEVNEDGEIHFGVGQSQAGLSGEVINDANRGVPGVTVIVVADARQLTATTVGDGRFAISRMGPGRYTAFIDADSLPVGYRIDAPARTELSVTPERPGNVTLRLKAIRNVSGRVAMYDRTAGQYRPVGGAQVTLRELGLKILTDKDGRFLFRELPPGVFTLTAMYAEKSLNLVVRLPDGPAEMENVDIVMGQQ